MDLNDKMSGLSNETCWESILSLAEEVKKAQKPIEFCSLTFGLKTSVHLNRFPPQKSKSLNAVFFLDPDKIKSVPDHIHGAFLITDVIQVSEIISSGLPKEFIQMIKTYAPYCFASVYAKRWKRAFAVSHLAQTLDGRIATVAGDSKWIGSRGNFIHAHRMRALMDGIVIGSKTLMKDKPQLTVRHVPGKNPCPVIIGSSLRILKCFLHDRNEPIFFVTSKTQVQDQRIRALVLDRINGIIKGSEILKSLYSQGIHSVYIEGGSFTTSHFLEDESVDVLQLHVSPLMLGSGINSFNLPVIQNISSAVQFRDSKFLPVDKGIMFIGIPDSNGTKRKNR